MLTHQRAVIGGARLQRCAHTGIARGVQGIAQRHGHVAQPALVANTADRAALGQAQKSRFILRKEMHQLLVCQPCPRIEVG